ncbi:MAG: H-NS histone family protein [Rubrivivax sp.]|jgi:DNA-binding protein H-NS|nr:H-NS histone family protein [Rubrivivax sp.]
MPTPTLSELLEQKAALERQIAETQREERAAAVSQIRSLMAQYGLTLADLSAKASPPAKKAGGKVPPKFRDPATGSTWSGRGLQPTWLREALASGRSLAEFAI